MSFRAWPWVLFLSAGTCGCLRNTYTIPRDELIRLAEVPAAHRGTRVRVVQDIGLGSDTRGSATAEAADDEPRPPVRLHASTVWRPAHRGSHAQLDTEHTRAPPAALGPPNPSGPGTTTPAAVPPAAGGGSTSAAPRALGGPNVVPTPTPVAPSGPASASPPSALGPARAHRPLPALVDGASTPAQDPPPALGDRSASVGPPPAAPPQPSDAQGSGSSSQSSKKSETLKALPLLVAATVVAVAAGGFWLAATEGARYDGWVEVDPDDMVYLTESRHRRWRAVRLSSLTPAMVDETDEARLVDNPASRLRRLGRAPLDRAGANLVTSLHLAGVPQWDRTLAPGVGAHVHFGVNILQFVTLGAAFTADAGLLGDFGLFSIGPELTVFPTRYVGLYGGVAYAYRVGQTSGPQQAEGGALYRYGVIGEVPFTTRLALQLRAGAWMPDLRPVGLLLGFETTVGVAVY